MRGKGNGGRRVALGVLAIAAAACGGSYKSSDFSPRSASAAMAPGAPPPPPMAAPVAGQSEADIGKLADNSPPGGNGDKSLVSDASRAPMLIYTATLTLAVFDVAPKLHEVEDLARSMGGFLSRRTDTMIVIRVPASKFNAALETLVKLGDVLHRDATAQDVTEEFADLEIRMRNARATRDRLEQLMAKATNVQDSIAIEKELSRVAGDIERLEGRLKFLRDRAAYSTITVTFEARRSEGTSPTVKLPFPWLDELGLSHLLAL